MKNDQEGRKHGRTDEETSAGGASAGPAPHRYEARAELRPKGLSGISEDQIAQHWKLYEGYVKNANALNEKIVALAARKEFGPEFAELKRRLGYEYDGMILHEHYFGALKPGAKPLGDDSALIKQMKRSFGGFSNWKEEFAAIGKMRGVGWTILYYDTRVRSLTNHWIGLHQDGHPAGFTPILVMDVWEHAYMVDAGVDGRPAYIEAFFKNVDWSKADRVLADADRAAAGMTLQER
jgi:Fe-Mn family superoxide dismutase